MGADSPRSRGKQPAWKAAAGGPDPRGPQYKWKKEDAAPPGTGGRRLKQVLLLGATLACLAGIVWLVLYFWPTDQPCFVVVSADPALDADRLDVPLDLYGWQTANEFLKHGQERAEQSTVWISKAPTPPTADGGGPLRLPETEDKLPLWAEDLKRYDPLVIYVGLHGGTDGSGQPFLFTGGRNRISVAALLATLSGDTLKAKRKVLILDCGRLPPDPVYGQIHDDFAARVKALNQAVRDDPNLVVLCGASDGQRGWESEELRATSFGHAVLRCLRGEIDTGESNNVITARALFESARQKTREWAQSNRPAAQEPFLLPDGDEGLTRAAAIHLGKKPNPPPNGPAPTPAPLLPALAQQWAAHDALAEQTPGPAAYAPRAWRRYREMLLRYEQAVRIGNSSVTDKLAPALTAARGEIEGAAVGKLESVRGSVALWAAVNADALDPTDADLANFPQEEGRQIGYAARALLQFDNDTGALPVRLANVAARLKKFEPPDRRPAEAHLPVMVEDFYARVLGQSPPDPPAGWAAAVGARSAAERAAAGLPIPDSTAPDRVGRIGVKAAVYPERVWPMTRPLVRAGDAKRRKAEDALFASDPKKHAEAGELLQAARKDYTDAAAIAQAARAAFDVRDTVLADLPFLSRWYAERYASAKDAADLIDLWDKVHALASELDELTANPPDVERARAVGKTAAGIGERYAKLLADFRTEADRGDAALQAEWWAKQQLLSVPLIAAEKRAVVLARSRHASGSLLADPNQARKATSEAVKADKKAAEVRGKLARAALGNRLLDAQHEADKALPKADFLDRDLTAIATTDQWTGHAAQVGAGLAGHHARLAADGATPSPGPDLRAERVSRTAIPFDAVAGWEPAAANHRLRWRAYLTELSERTADDHWYDEKQSPVPYFKAVAKRYLADAERITANLIAGTPPGTKGTWDAPPSASLAAKLDAPALAARDLDPITWTSELGRTIPFDLGPLPNGYPVTGEAVAVGRFGDAAPIRPTDAALARPLLPIPGDSLGLAAELRLDVGAEEVTKTGGRAACTVYFRGQRPTQHVRIDLRRKPELVIADPPPAEKDRGNFVAVRADRNLELGSVVILLDYSGSMKGDLKGYKLPNNNWKTGPSRFNHAMTALERLLGELPEKTPLRIRVFSGKRATGGSEVVFGTGQGDDRPAVNWNGPDDPRLKKLIGKLRDIEPDGETPLVRSMIDAAASDFDDLPSGSRTLLVVTDGAENDQAEPKRADEAADQYALRRGRVLAEGFKGLGLPVHVAQFALGDEKASSDKLFEPLRRQQGDLVWLWPANTDKELQQALLDAIRPKLRLADRRGERPRGFPRTGWPSRTADRREPPYSSFTLLWSPRAPDDVEGPLKASAFPARVPSPSELDLRPGELMILGFDSEGQRVRVRRELYADYLPDSPDSRTKMKTRRGDESWALSAPAGVIDDQVSPPEFLSRAFLEQVPSHRRGKGDRDADIGPLGFTHPDLTWWQVTPAVGKGESPTPTGTVRVTRKYGYPAPGWDVRVEDWPHRPVRPAEFKVWAADSAPGATFEACRPGESRSLTTPTGDQIDMRAALEKWQPVGAAAPVDCLVVRFTFDKGKPIQVRPVDVAATYAEHRYYGSGTGADGMIAYTAVFQLPVEKLKASGVRLKLIPVQPSRTDANLLTLTPPEPDRGKALRMDSPPQPSRATE